MSDFRPLSTPSQAGRTPTLYLDARACPLALLDAAERRTSAVADLLEVLTTVQLETHQPNALARVADAAVLLLNDASDLQQAARRNLHALNRPQAASPTSPGA